MKKGIDSRILFVFAMLIFGSVGVFVKSITLSSGIITLTRGVIGSIIISLYVLISRTHLNFKQIKKQLPLLCISGAVMGGNWIFLFEAYKNMSVGVATVIYYFAPIIVFIASFFLFRDKFSLPKLIGILSSVIGIIVINFDSSITSSTYGIFSAFMSAVLYAGVMIFNKYFKNLSGLETTLVQMVSATVMLIIYVAVTERGTVFSPSMQEVIMLIIVGVIHTGFAYVIYFSSMQKMNTQNTAILSYIDPASALIFSTIFLNERMSIMGIIGAVLILGGTIFSQLYKSKKEV